MFLLNGALTKLWSLFQISKILWQWRRWKDHRMHNTGCHITMLGWGLLSQFPPFRYFPNFSSLSKHTLTVKYRIYIWQVSPQLSCGDTCQIWMWFVESNMYFCEIENFAYGEINERSFSNSHPWFGCFITLCKLSEPKTTLDQSDRRICNWVSCTCVYRSSTKSNASDLNNRHTVIL